MMDGDAPKRDPYLHSRGLKVPKDPAITHGKMRRDIKLEGYEDKEARAVQRLIRHGDKVLELGGGIGYISTLAASKRNLEWVHIYEANPRLIPYIKRMHEANDVTCATVQCNDERPRRLQVRGFGHVD